MITPIFGPWKAGVKPLFFHCFLIALLTYLGNCAYHTCMWRVLVVSFAASLFLRLFPILPLWNDFSACDFKFKLTMMLSHFAATDEMEFLFGNGKKPLCVFVCLSKTCTHTI